MEYSKTHCHFCNSELRDKYPRMCPDVICFNKHVYMVGSDYIKIEINGYTFVMFDDGSMSLQEPPPVEIKVNCILNIKIDNYLEQAERIKRLQVFS